MVLRLTSSHVKTRRLNYLYKLAEILETKGPTPQVTLIATTEEWAIKNRNYLKNHVDSTGEISTPYAGKRYLNFSKELGLITSLANALENTILGNVLSKLDKVGEQPYKLSCMSKCFLLKRLLYCDFDYLTTITHQLINKETDFVSFKKYLQEHFERSYPSGVPMGGAKLLRQMEHWKGPKKFFEENIIAPRKAWLIDLEIVDLEKFRDTSRIEFNDQQNQFLTKLWNLQRKQLYAFLENEYYNEFVALIGNKNDFVEFSDLIRKNKKQNVMEYLERAFSLFSNRYLNRISSRSFFEYILCYAPCQENIVCRRRDMEKIVLEISGSRASPYRYRKVEEISENGIMVEAGYITADT